MEVLVSCQLSMVGGEEDSGFIVTRDRYANLGRGYTAVGNGMARLCAARVLFGIGLVEDY